MFVLKTSRPVCFFAVVGRPDQCQHGGGLAAPRLHLRHWYVRSSTLVTAPLRKSLEVFVGLGNGCASIWVTWAMFLHRRRCITHLSSCVLHFSLTL